MFARTSWRECATRPDFILELSFTERDLESDSHYYDFLFSTIGLGYHSARGRIALSNAASTNRSEPVVMCLFSLVFPTSPQSSTMHHKGCYGSQSWVENCRQLNAPVRSIHKPKTEALA